ncbi:MAG TPA: T9SS type A sorting domain-containing protein, partial [Bacteroidota bacterium]|nr:T9SS type A sorting domain-containing protein [Bacteroidota bacterium]
TWNAVGAGLPSTTTQSSVISLGVSGTNIFAGTSGNGAYLSTNNGNSWNAVNSGLNNTNVLSVMANGSYLFAGTNFGSYLFRSTDSGTTWTTANNGLTFPITGVNVFAVIGAKTFAGTTNGVFVSTDNGDNWNDANTNLTMYYRDVSSLAVIGTNLFAAVGSGTGNSGVYLSTDNGSTWNKTSLSPSNASINVLAVTPWGADSTNLFAGTLDAGVYLSTDNGTTWNPANSGLTNNRINCFATSANGTGGTNLFAGVDFGGVFLSTNNGTSWNSVNNGIAGININALAAYDSNIIAGATSGTYLSTNNGGTWKAFNTGLPVNGPYAQVFPTINSLTISGSDIIAGTFFLGVWKRPISQVTSVNLSSYEIPTAIQLGQNFPNPFNPTTTITFQIPTADHVVLKVFDVLGREVATLVNKEFMPGIYEAKFNGAQLASGVYFYRLQTSRFVQTRKILLQK